MTFGCVLFQYIESMIIGKIKILVVYLSLVDYVYRHNTRNLIFYHQLCALV